MDGKETILIADDADLNRAILRNLFEDEYITCWRQRTESRPLFCCGSTANESPWFSLDLVMPEKDGYEVLKEMQETRFLYHSQSS